MTGICSRGVRWTAVIAVFLCVFAFSFSASLRAQEQTVRIAAASSMRFLLDDLVDAYSDETGDSKLQAIYGSSGNLYRQILQGAPYDLFLSADVQYINDLESENRLAESALFAPGTLVLYSDEGISADEMFGSLTNAVRTGEFQGKPLKIAIGNPAHAPFGKAAKEVMQQLGIWAKSRTHLIIADSVSQAAQFARTGAVSFAFVAQSLVGQLAGQSMVVPQEYYSPLQLELGVLNESPTALAFLEFTQSEQARKYFEKYELRMGVNDGG